MSTPPISPNHTPNSQPVPHTPPQQTFTHTVPAVAQQILQTPPTTSRGAPPAIPRFMQQLSETEDSTSNSLFDFLNSPLNSESPQSSAPNTGERVNRLEENTHTIRNIQDTAPLPIFGGNWREDLDALPSQPLFGVGRASQSRRTPRDSQEAMLVSQRIRQLENRLHRNATLLATRRGWEDRSNPPAPGIRGVHIQAPTADQWAILESVLPRSLHERYNQRTDTVTVEEELYASLRDLHPTLFPSIWPRN